MRVSPNAVLIVGICGVVFALLQFPMTKFSTTDALRALEEKYVRKDLSEQDQKSVKGLGEWIVRNERACASAYTMTLGSLAVVVILSGVGALQERARRRSKHQAAEPGATDNPDNAQ